MKSFAVAFACLTLAAAAHAQTTQPRQNSEEPEAQETQQRPRDKNDQLICRRVEDTGSRVPQRVCLTRRQWRTYGDR